MTGNMVARVLRSFPVKNAWRCLQYKSKVQTSGIPEAETFGQKRKFSAFGLQFRPPNLEAEYGRKSNFRIIDQNTSLLKKIAGNVQEYFEKKN